MAQIMTKRGNQENIVTYEFVCDTAADLQKIEQEYITIGSIATVIAGETGFEVYMANSQKEWVSLGNATSSENNGGSNSDNTSTWINQDIIEIPETVAALAGGWNFQENMQINNHVITGTLNIPYLFMDNISNIPIISETTLTYNNDIQLDHDFYYWPIEVIQPLSENETALQWWEDNLGNDIEFTVSPAPIDVSSSDAFHGAPQVTTHLYMIRGDLSKVKAFLYFYKISKEGIAALQTMLQDDPSNQSVRSYLIHACAQPDAIYELKITQSR